MKRKHYLLTSSWPLLLAGVLATTATHDSKAQVWESVDSIPGGAHGDTIIQLPDGSLLNAFRIIVEGDFSRDSEWVTRWNADGQGTSWQEIDYWPIEDDQLETEPISAVSYRNLQNNTIEVFVVGRAKVNDVVTKGKGKWETTEYYEVNRWVVRRGVLSLDSQSWTWETVRMFGNESGVVQELYEARDVAIDADGVIYVTGNSNYYWLTEASYDGGDTWVESDRWRLDSADLSYGKGIAVGPDGSVFVSGFGSEEIPGEGKGKNKTPSTFVWHWITRKLDPTTQTWSVVDDYVGWNQAYANDVVITSDGILLVCGKSEPEYAGNPGGDSHWIIRASADNGATWDTVDDYKPLEGTSVAYIPYSISEAPDGTVYVAGMFDLDPESFGEGTYTFGIRKSEPNDLLSWSVDYVLPQEWLDLRGGIEILAVESPLGGGTYLYCSEAGSDPDAALIRKPIP